MEFPAFDGVSNFVEQSHRTTVELGRLPVLTEPPQRVCLGAQCESGRFLVPQLICNRDCGIGEIACFLKIDAYQRAYGSIQTCDE